MVGEDAVSGSVEGDPGRDRLLAQIKVWRDELINLARSNRLLYFKHTRSSTIEVTDGASPTELVSSLLGGTAWRFSPAAAISDAPDEPPLLPVRTLRTNKDETGLERALRALDRRATEEFMEKGLWILYLAVGMLRWVDPDTDEAADSPILLVPVSLSRENPREPFTLKRADEEPVMNPALIVKLSEFGITLPSLEDVDQLDVDALIAGVASAIDSNPEWAIEHRLVISPFSFHKAVMFKDLLDHEEEIASHGLVGALVHGPSAGAPLDFQPIPEDALDRDAPPESVATILDADATQRQCIDAAARGNSFVMDGPPGTGKSQTIANIIAELMNRGRTVLFVSEKAAALEVVAKRLDAAGLGDYALELHSHKATRREVAQELGRALTRHPAERPALSAAEVARLRQRRVELSDRAQVLNEVRPALGRSLHEIVGRIGQLDDVPLAPPAEGVGLDLDAQRLTRILSTAETLSRSWGPVTRGPDFLWRRLVDSRMDGARRYRVGAEMTEAIDSLSAVEMATADLEELVSWPHCRGFAEAETLARVAAHLEKRPPAPVPAHWLTTDENFERVAARIRSLREMIEARSTLIARLIASSGDAWRQLPVLPRGAGQDRLDALAPPEFRWDCASTPVELLAEFAAFLGQTLELLDAVQTSAPMVADAFGLSSERLSLRRTRDLGELAEIARRPQRPESEWINPALISSVRLAAAVLEPLISSLNERRRALGETFSDEVLDLDLEGLCARFEQVHLGWRKLTGAYRADKRAVAAVTRSKKADKAALGQLRDALEWQRLSREVDDAAASHAEVLGTYYRRERSDFAAIATSLEGVQRALAIAGSELDVTAMRRQLARDGEPAGSAHSVAEELRARIEAWRASAPTFLTGLTEPLELMPLSAARALLHSISLESQGFARELDLLVQTRPVMLLREAAQVLEDRAAVAEIEQALETHLSADGTLLGAAYRGVDTDWKVLEISTEWARELRVLVGRSLTEESVVTFLSANVSSRELDSSLARFGRARAAITANFMDEEARTLSRDFATTFDEVRELVEHLAATVSDVDEWAEYSQACDELKLSGVAAPLAFAIEQRVPASQLTAVIERAVLGTYADVVIESERARLGSLRSDQLDSVLDEFRRLDSALVAHAASAVVSSCNARRPMTTLGAAGIIQREATKQRRHMPVRELLQQAGEVAQALKPCFMMSPLTVSQFLPSTMSFDTVIFDEASQVRPSDAINCIYRGSHLIVAGDDKQLPPTSFFERVGVSGDDDEWDEDQFDDFESVLSLCKGSGGMRELPLRWHYRSQHEGLITYSNYAFYAPGGHPLVTFPGAIQESPELGVALFHVPEGVYRRGGGRDNPVEAQQVAERVFEWARRGLREPEAAVTVGVVAFSEAQATAIEAAIEAGRQGSPELDDFFSSDRLDGFFVKNLENVQGDERDVMIFSIGYGRDEVGRFTLNFGPLNRSGGQRRLNVAITRARRRVEIVSSVSAGDFPAELSSPGVQHLHRYLDFAERGPAALALEIGESNLDAESPFEEAVLSVLRSWGYDAVPQVGVSGYRVDIGVRHPTRPGRFAIGIECDGAMYHSSKVARDRDRLRQEVLERLGWRIHRIWGTSWYRDRARQEEHLRAAVEAAVNAADASPRPRTVTVVAVPAPALQEVELDAWPEWASPYLPSAPRGPRNSGLEMHDPQARADLRRMVAEVVQAEGPVTEEVVLRRVREAWGVARAGSRIRDAFADVVDGLVSRNTIYRVDERFLSPTTELITGARVPFNDEDARRSVDEVPAAELDFAVERTLADALRVSEEELTRQVAWLFGWNRRGPEISRALHEAVGRLVERGRVAEVDGQLLCIPE